MIFLEMDFFWKWVYVLDAYTNTVTNTVIPPRSRRKTDHRQLHYTRAVATLISSAIPKASSSSLVALFLAQACSTGAVTVSVALSSLLMTHLSGSETWSGLPSTLKQVASSVAALAVGHLMARSGRRLGLTLSYIIAASGAILGGWAALHGSVIGFLIGVILLGIGDGGIPQGRYAVAELVVPAFRGRIVGYLLSFGVLGSFLAAALTPLLQRIAKSQNLPSLELGWILGGILLLLGSILIGSMMRAKPLELTSSSAISEHTALEPVSSRNPWQIPNVRLSLVSLSIGQGVMVMMMVLTPLHAQHMGHSLPTISSLITAHLVGMFGLAWLTGNLIDRFGSHLFIALGALLLASSAVLAFFATSAFWIGASLFVLGLGWNWCYVAGSSLLTHSLHPLERSKIGGQVDFAVWGAAAVGSLLGGVIVANLGFGTLSVFSVLVSLIPLLALWRFVAARGEK
jgi:MFS family permease